MDQKTLSLADLLEQEHTLQFAAFDNDVAWRLGVRLVEAARAAGLPVTIDISRGTHQLFHAALAGTSADNDEWIRRKNRTVHRFGHSSYYVGRTWTDKGAKFEDQPHWDQLLHAAHGGAFPVLVRGGGLVGTITVSGLPQDEDHELVVTVLEQFLADEANYS
ncbi:MAG: heme-degrading domain-containing protein [Mycobacteriales bacterium]